MKIVARAAHCRIGIALLTLGVVSCGGSIGSPAKDAGTAAHGGTGATGGAAGVGGRGGSGGSKPGDAGVKPDSGPPEPIDSATLIVPVSGTVESTPPADTGLPDLPRLTSVSAAIVGDSVTIGFDPVDEAVDYRVYALPSKADVKAGGDGRISIQNAVYRCAGNRQAPTIPTDGEAQVQGGALSTIIDGHDVDGTTRSMSNATLGYVYPEPAADRVPVYALGDGSADSDNSCFFQRFTASRVKQYVTSDAERKALLAKGSRDDGIAFYAPAAASGSTKQIDTSTSDRARYYFVSGSESRSGAKPVFNVLANKADGSVPLMRAFYSNGCGRSHDELVAGGARFAKLRKQGDLTPVTKLHWSGLTGPTTLVVEALDQGCPFQGIVAPAKLGASGQYQPWKTPTDIQSAAPNHELFINGQFDGTNPRAIARTFVKVQPASKPDLDWSYGFSTNDDLGTFKPTACGADNCFMIYRQTSDPVDVSFMSVESDRYAHGKLFGEWWVAYTDWAADTNGKYRLTPAKKAELSADSYLFVAMEVDSFTTARRYPQLLISDRDAPVQINLPQGNTLILQTFGDWPNRYELQVCDHRNWDVNDQCPRFDFYHQHDKGSSDEVSGLAPNVEVGEQIGLDVTNRYEMFVSTKRAYVFLDGQPYGCADLPSAGVPSGPVTVTFGDVLYHSGVDALFSFTEKQRKTVAVRHFDNLGFKSRVSAPAWDETRYPCTSTLRPD